MPAIWGLPPLTDSIEGDKTIRLSTGSIIDIADLNIRLNNKPPQSKIDTIVARVQARIDVIVPLSSLPDDEPTKIMTSVKLNAQYGGRVFLDGVGNIVSRSTRFSLTWENGRLVPHWETVR